MLGIEYVQLAQAATMAVGRVASPYARGYHSILAATPVALVPDVSGREFWPVTEALRERYDRLRAQGRRPVCKRMEAFRQGRREEGEERKETRRTQEPDACPLPDEETTLATWMATLM